ncbi:MAG: patatin-like phospholipase family protein [Deltaproteobacteria bacterium]|nr:patatin-like phospholipase family protein [Deltaproteobacteria bacterium]
MNATPQPPPWFLRLLGNFSVQRPFYIFGAIILYLPVTALKNIFGFEPPGHSVLGNLFVEFRFWDGFWFGFALLGAVWATMLTACLNLDGERDLPDRWTYNLPRNRRRVTIPMNHASTFVLFTMLAGPGAIVVTSEAVNPSGVACGFVLGGALAYLCMDIVAFLVICDYPGYRVLPWGPLAIWDSLRVRKLTFLTSFVLGIVSWGARKAGLSAHFFTSPDRQKLRAEQLFSIVSFLAVSTIYWIVYRIMKPESWTHLVNIDSLPPVAFIFALLLPIIWLLSALWFHLRRYRIALIVAVIYGISIYGLAENSDFIQRNLGGPAHTYDVFLTRSGQSFGAGDVLQPLVDSFQDSGKKSHLVIVAASGGGILAAGWTTKVLTELHNDYPNFRPELRLISGVSGGSVGAAHYVCAHGEGTNPLSKAVLQEVVENALKTSLSITAYGFAFPDFRRAIFPIWTDEDFDRGRLAEADWRKISNNLNKRDPKELVLLSDWRDAIRNGSKPAVIFNTTVMENGARIALTPISSLESKWAGWKIEGRETDPTRYNYAKTLSEFIGTKEQYSVDVWTAARLSATFSYVSPAARASFAQLDGGQVTTRTIPENNSPGLLHLIDGGYHDNSGVASALDWLTAALQDLTEKHQEIPFDRIALVEIRAKPFQPPMKASSQWEAAWLGPVYGLLNSWDFTQTAADDTAVNRMIERFKTSLDLKGVTVKLESFVFVPEETGPLSWHLSEEQKKFIHESWKTKKVCATRRAFLRYVNDMDPEKPVNLPKPLDDCPSD